MAFGEYQPSQDHGRRIPRTNASSPSSPQETRRKSSPDPLQSLLQQNVEVVLVDDGSTDGTAEVARTVPGNLTILPGQPLEPGWTGKLWALAQGAAYAEKLSPDYFLFTDADIHHGAHSVADLVSIADARDCDLASYMVKLACVTTAEKALIPAFVFFFLMLYPPAWIASERFKTAGAAGGCVLIRPGALESIGGWPP